MVSSSYNALHQHLKLATAAAHSGLECVLAKRGYFDGREQYIHYLQRFLAFQEEAEQVLDTSITVDAVPDWSERRRAHLARADLETLGAPVRAFPRSCGRLPEVAHLRHVKAESIAAAAIAMFAAARYYLTEAEPVSATSAARACSMVA